MPFNPADGNTGEYKALEDGWHRFVRSGTHPVVYWDPTDKRWEDYPKEDYGATRTGLAPVVLGNRVDLPFLILQEVYAVGGLLRSLGNSAIWNPRDGYWYWYWRKDRPAPVIAEPNWMTRMNRELDAIEQNTRMSPEEKQRARIAVIDSYTSGRID